MSKPVPGWRSTVVQVFLLLVCSSLAGLAVNHQLVLDAFAGRLTAAVEPVSSDGDLSNFPIPALMADLDELTEQGALLIDARPQDLYALGHIAGAVSLPMLDLEEVYPDFRASVPLGRKVITYCSGYGCQDSFDLAMHLILDGYQSVYIYEGGFPEWQAAGRPVEGEGL